MQKQVKKSNYGVIGNDPEKQRQYTITLDKDIQNLFEYVNSLRAMPDGIATGDLLYWDNDAQTWQLLTASDFSKVLTSGGFNRPPFWDYVFQSPGAEYGGKLYYYVNLYSSYFILQIGINEAIAQSAALSIAYSFDVTNQGVIFSTANTLNILAMNQSSNVVAALGTSANLVVA